VSGATGAFGIATFQSTHAVLKAESLLKGAGLAGVRLVPVANDLQGIFVEAPGGWVPFP